MRFYPTIILVFTIYFISGLRIVNLYERRIVFTFWKYTTILEPWLRFVWPIFQSTYKINLNKNIDELSVELKNLEIPAEITMNLLNEIKKPNNSNIQQNESIRKD
jgi:regulator of protease activity HflC (stomatin/prohibitin superfamily)